MLSRLKLIRSHLEYDGFSRGYAWARGEKMSQIVKIVGQMAAPSWLGAISESHIKPIPEPRRPIPRLSKSISTLDDGPESYSESFSWHIRAAIASIGLIEPKLCHWMLLNASVNIWWLELIELLLISFNGIILTEIMTGMEALIQDSLNSLQLFMI